MKKFPKKFKLITDGGFYKIIKMKRFVPRIWIPVSKKITYSSPLVYQLEKDCNITFEFVFDRVYKGYAEYKQANYSTVIR